MHLPSQQGLLFKLNLLSDTGKQYKLIPRETILQPAETVLFCLVPPVTDRATNVPVLRGHGECSGEWGD